MRRWLRWAVACQSSSLGSWRCTDLHPGVSGPGDRRCHGAGSSSSKGSGLFRCLVSAGGSYVSREGTRAASSAVKCRACASQSWSVAPKCCRTSSSSCASDRVNSGRRGSYSSGIPDAGSRSSSMSGATDTGGAGYGYPAACKGSCTARGQTPPAATTWSQLPTSPRPRRPAPWPCRWHRPAPVRTRSRRWPASAPTTPSTSGLLRKTSGP